MSMGQSGVTDHAHEWQHYHADYCHRYESGARSARAVRSATSRLASGTSATWTAYFGGIGAEKAASTARR